MARKKWEYSFVYYDANGFATVMEDAKSGFLRCGECGDTADWCRHMEGSVRQREDAQSMWEIFDKELCSDLQEHFPHHTIFVPISPTNKLWAEVEVFRSAMIPSAMAMLLMGSGTKAGVVADLGYLNRGDGRNVIRSIIVDWFQGKVEGSLVCQAGAHGFSQEMQWQKNVKSPHMNLFENWSIYFNEQCLSCFQRNMTNANQWPDDLVPEEEKKNWSSSMPF